MEALEIKNISKNFGGVKALTNINFSVGTRQICSIVGENGAGKSTLMKIIAGAISPDAGEIIVQGKKIRFFTPIEAHKYGIGIVYQELSVAKNLTVYENVFLGKLKTRGLGICKHKEMKEICKNVLKEVGLEDIPPETVVNDLSAAKQQLVEIARVLMVDPQIIIMDEPTSSLADEDSKRLLDLLVDIRNKGKTILYISHRLNEVKQISDKIVVLRDGKYVGQSDAGGLSNEDIVKMMVGEKVTQVYREKKTIHKTSSAILEVKNLCVPPKVKDASFKLYKGEVLGIAGLVGAGRSELVRGVFGLDRATYGEVFINGKRVRKLDPSNAIMAETNICFVSEDRKKEGLVFGKSVHENIIMSFRQKGYSGMAIKEKLEREKARYYQKQLMVKAGSHEDYVENLSGGNQQKVILARCLAVKPKIMILDEPTRGIDVGAKSEIHRIILDLADSGVSILVVSSELPELSVLCDRVLVMSDGRIVHELEYDMINETEMLRYAIPS